MLSSKIRQTIENHKINVQDKILCAISGGIDSTVMLHILSQLGFESVVAHCNFQLRGNDSDKDEIFVENLAKKLNYIFVSQRFDTHSFAKENKLSIEMAARNLRYDWFNKTAKEFNCKYIAIAHNSDDQIETFFINLLRGTGIRGLRAMDFVKNQYFRPLLNISREEIHEFALQNNIPWREDRTNATTEFVRNKIRHSIIPVLNEINPSAKNNILKTINILKDTEKIQEIFINNLNFESDKEIFLNKLPDISAKETIIFELLRLKGINSNLATQALENLADSESGKFVEDENYIILKDREKLIINEKTKINQSEQSEITINSLPYSDKNNGISMNLKIMSDDILENISQKKKKSFTNNKNINYLDFDKLKFPLTIRKWQTGDKFIPLGMNNFKKLSDFFIDKKINLINKQDILVLTSAEDIIYVFDYQIDNRYKISEKTKCVLEIMG